MSAELDPLSPLLLPERGEAGEQLLSPEGERAVRDCINTMIGGSVPAGVSLEWLSCFDLDATGDAPAHEAGMRTFRLVVPSSDGGAFVAFYLTALEPGSDSLQIPMGDYLAPIAESEKHLGEVNVLALDLPGLPLPRARDRRDFADMLGSAERGTNAQMDRMRESGANPKRWLPIGPDAVRCGRVEIFRANPPEGSA